MRNFSFLPDRALKVAILGSSGAVGSELLKILEERNFPISDLILLSSARSSGKKIIWNNTEVRDVIVDAITKDVSLKSFSLNRKTLFLIKD